MARVKHADRTPDRRPTRKPFRWVWKGAGVLILAYVGAAIVLTLLQSRLVFQPGRRELAATPPEMGMDYEDVTLETSDGLRLHGWFIPAAGARATTLFCHGNAGNISRRMETIAALHRLRLNVLIFDYRGYGQSEGSPTEEGTYKDAEAAWRYLTETKGVAPERIVIHGRSLGGAVAAHLARDHTPGALLLESTFTSAPDLAARLLWFLPARRLCRFKYDTLAAVREVRCPILIIHSPDDDLVPYKMGQKLFEAAAEPKQSLRLRGGHNEGFVLAAEDYHTWIDDFLHRYVDAAQPRETSDGPAAVP